MDWNVVEFTEEEIEYLFYTGTESVTGYCNGEMQIYLKVDSKVPNIKTVSVVFVKNGEENKLAGMFRYTEDNLKTFLRYIYCENYITLQQLQEVVNGLT